MQDLIGEDTIEVFNEKKILENLKSNLLNVETAEKYSRSGFLCQLLAICQFGYSVYYDVCFLLLKIFCITRYLSIFHCSKNSTFMIFEENVLLS